MPDMLEDEFDDEQQINVLEEFLGVSRPAEQVSKDEVLRAAVCFENAVSLCSVRCGNSQEIIQRYRTLQLLNVQRVISLVVSVNVCLAFVELPTAPMLRADPSNVVALEALTLVGLSFIFYLRATTYAPSTFWRSHMNIVTAVVLALSMGELTISLVADLPILRFRRFLRPWFILYTSKSVRQAVRGVRRTVFDVLDVFVLLGFVVFFYAILLLVALGGTPAGDVYHFDDLAQGGLQLFILETTANFPDVMLPAYRENDLWAFVFISYLVVALFFFANLILAVVFSKYKQHFTGELKRGADLRVRLLNEVFTRLDCGTRDAISFELFDLLMREVAEGPARSSFGGVESPARRKLLFRLLDTDDSGFLARAEFQELVEMCDIDFCDNAVPSRYDRLVPAGNARRIRTVVNHPAFDYTIDFLIIVNAGFVALGFYAYHHNMSMRSLQRVVEIVLTAIFASEALLKVFTFGWKRYWRNSWNRFDLFVVVAAIVSALAAFVLPSSWDGAQSTISRGVILIRALRITRLIGRVRRFRIVLAAMRSIVPLMATYGVVLFCLYYVFALWGVEMWGGAIYEENTALHGTLFADNDYYPMNFNTFFHGLVTLFALTVVNNWHVIASGFAAVSAPYGALAWLWFIFFLVLSTSIVANILIAFSLELFEMQRAWFEQVDERGDPVENRLAEIDPEGRWTIVRKTKRGQNAWLRLYKDEISQSG